METYVNTTVNPSRDAWSSATHEALVPWSGTSAFSDLATITLAQEQLDAHANAAALSLSLIRSRRNALSPISRLPAELLSHIFSYLVLLDPPSGGPSDLGTLGWIHVTHVCRAWREIAVGNPALWTIIPFSESDEWASEALRRSKKCPLTVKATFEREEDSEAWSKEEPLAVALSELYRVRNLDLSGTLDHHAVALLDWGLKQEAPILESLKLKFNAVLGAPTYTYPASLVAPKLREVSLHGIAPPFTSISNLTQLTYLEIRKPPGPRLELHGLLDLLASQPALETLILQSVMHPPGPAFHAADSRRVQLPLLRKFLFAGWLHTCAYLVRHLGIPPASAVTYELGCLDGPAEPYLLEFFRFLAPHSGVYEVEGGNGAMTKPMRALAVRGADCRCINIRGWDWDDTRGLPISVPGGATSPGNGNTNATSSSSAHTFSNANMRTPLMGSSALKDIDEPKIQVTLNPTSRFLPDFISEMFLNLCHSLYLDEMQVLRVFFDQVAFGPELWGEALGRARKLVSCELSGPSAPGFVRKLGMVPPPVRMPQGTDMTLAMALEGASGAGVSMDMGEEEDQGALQSNAMDMGTAMDAFISAVDGSDDALSGFALNGSNANNGSPSAQSSSDIINRENLFVPNLQRLWLQDVDFSPHIPGITRCPAMSNNANVNVNANSNTGSGSILSPTPFRLRKMNGGLLRELKFTKCVVDQATVQALKDASASVASGSSSGQGGGAEGLGMSVIWDQWTGYAHGHGHTHHFVHPIHPHPNQHGHGIGAVGGGAGAGGAAGGAVVAAGGGGGGGAAATGGGAGTGGGHVIQLASVPVIPVTVQQGMSVTVSHPGVNLTIHVQHQHHGHGHLHTHPHPHHAQAHPLLHQQPPSLHTIQAVAQQQQQQQQQQHPHPHPHPQQQQQHHHLQLQHVHQHPQHPIIHHVQHQHPHPHPHAQAPPPTQQQQYLQQYVQAMQQQHQQHVAQAQQLHLAHVQQHQQQVQQQQQQFQQQLQQQVNQQAQQVQQQMQQHAQQQSQHHQQMQQVQILPQQYHQQQHAQQLSQALMQHQMQAQGHAQAQSQNQGTDQDGNDGQGQSSQ